MRKVKKIRNVYSVEEHCDGKHMMTTSFKYRWEALEYLTNAIGSGQKDFGFPFNENVDYVLITKIKLKRKVTFSSITFGIIEQSNIKKERIVYER